MEKTTEHLVYLVTLSNKIMIKQKQKIQYKNIDLKSQVQKKRKMLKKIKKFYFHLD